MTINVNDASFVSDKDAGILEKKRKIAFVSGHHFNLRNVKEIDVSGTWWRIWTADGKFHLVNPDKVNYVTSE